MQCGGVRSSEGKGNGQKTNANWPMQTVDHAFGLFRPRARPPAARAALHSEEALIRLVSSVLALIRVPSPSAIPITLPLLGYPTQVTYHAVHAAIRAVTPNGVRRAAFACDNHQEVRLRRASSPVSRRNPRSWFYLWYPDLKRQLRAWKILRPSQPPTFRPQHKAPLVLPPQ